MHSLLTDFQSLLTKELCEDTPTYDRFLARLADGNFSQDENPVSHFGVFFLPYDPFTKKVLIVHHKKANKWLFPGGHVDKGEGLLDTLHRETAEELGITNIVYRGPFLFSIIHPENKGYPCKEHLDTWYVITTSPEQLQVDLSEFFDTKWVTLEEAHAYTTDTHMEFALGRLKEFL